MEALKYCRWMVQSTKRRLKCFGSKFLIDHFNPVTKNEIDWFSSVYESCTLTFNRKFLQPLAMPLILANVNKRNKIPTFDSADERNHQCMTSYYLFCSLHLSIYLSIQLFIPLRFPFSKSISIFYTSLFFLYDLYIKIRHCCYIVIYEDTSSPFSFYVINE